MSRASFVAALTGVIILAWAAFAPSAELPHPTSAPTGRFTVYGKVTDVDGKGLPGIVVRANCGMGTLMATGETTTAGDGGYRLGFGPGFHNASAEHPVGFQAATIFAIKDGMFERDLGVQGNLAMTDRNDDDPLAKVFVHVVRPNQPYEVNFVMLPAARVEGNLMDAKGKPIPVRSIDIVGKKMPPSSSVLASAQTDAEGHFNFNSIPTSGTMWFHLNNFPKRPVEYASNEIEVLSPAHYRFKVTYNEAAEDPNQRLQCELVDSTGTPIKLP